MFTRVIDLIKETRTDYATLSVIFDALGYDRRRDYSLLTIIPDKIANIVRATCSKQNDLLEIVQIVADEGIYGKRNVPYWSVRNVVQHNDLYDTNVINRREETFTTHSPIYNSERDFWIKELIVLTSERKAHRLEIGSFERVKGEPLYSLLIGTNGAGKSSLMKEIIEFFIDLQICSNNDEYKEASFYNGYLKGIRYHIDGVECNIIKLEKNFIAIVDGQICELKNVHIPSIVACHFGAFDKLPITKVNGHSRTRYDLPYYNYVGAHVNGNMISSSAIAFRLLFALNGQMDDIQRQNICTILDLIGYDHVILMTYTFARRTKKEATVREVIAQRVEKDKEYKGYSVQEKKEMADHLYYYYRNKTDEGKLRNDYVINFDRKNIPNGYSNELQSIYKLKQYDLMDSAIVYFYKQGCAITTDDMSSGEFAMLSTVLSISAAADERHTLVLLDEPELSLHPNWQMTIIDYLDKALVNRSCHSLIATHSHLLVSDLPNKRSQVIQLEKDEQGDLKSTFIPECTYGWSAEEVLLKVFKTATDRNRYFGERIGNLLEQMGNDSITKEAVVDELEELQEISKHLSDIDPMKMILNTIVDTYK